MRLTIEQYAKKFKMSKEMVYSKIKNKKLPFVVEDGITYIPVQHTQQQPQRASTTAPATQKTKPTVSMIISLYQKENQQLKEKITHLEAKIDKLIDDKEQMLRDEMQRIEHLYSTKDEQLKTILELVNAKLAYEAKNNETIHEVEAIKPESSKPSERVVELKEYLKNLDLEPHQKKAIKKRFLAAYGSDIRVLKQNGKIFLNFSKYDYSDLLEY